MQLYFWNKITIYLKASSSDHGWKFLCFSSKARKVETESDTDKFIQPIHRILLVTLTSFIITINLSVSYILNRFLHYLPSFWGGFVQGFFSLHTLHPGKIAHPSVHWDDSFSTFFYRVIFVFAKFLIRLWSCLQDCVTKISFLPLSASLMSFFSFLKAFSACWQRKCCYSIIRWVVKT